MSKHTPGPWKAHFNVPFAAIEGHIIKTDYGAQCPIASLWVGGGTEGKPRQIANSHLIAAAPELLAACKDLLSEHKAMNEILISTGHGATTNSTSPAGMAFAAITKAESL